MSVTSAVPNLVALLESWTVHLRAERKSAQTVKSYTAGVRQFLSGCTGEGTPAVLDRATVNAFVASLLDSGAEAATARSRQLAVRPFSAWRVKLLRWPLKIRGWRLRPTRQGRQQLPDALAYSGRAECGRWKSRDRRATRAGTEDTERQAVPLRWVPGVHERDPDDEGDAGRSEENPLTR